MAEQEKINRDTKQAFVGIDTPAVISSEEIIALKKKFDCLIGLKINWLSLPAISLDGFEPSQLAVIVNTLIDAALPQIKLLGNDEENIEILSKLGLSKSPRDIGEREAYPDYITDSGYRVELKGLFVDNIELNMRRPPTAREPSARLKENVTMDVINPKTDVLLIAAVQFKEENNVCTPEIVDIGVFSMVECIKARDLRLSESSGRWFGKMPKVISLTGRVKLRRGVSISDLSEDDFQKDTNFGKLKRIPHKPLQDFLKKHGIVNGS